MINGGLGPEGAKLVAASLRTGGIKLEEIHCGRNRLEDDGYIAITEVLGEMGTLRRIEMP